MLMAHAAESKITSGSSSVGSQNCLVETPLKEAIPIELQYRCLATWGRFFVVNGQVQ